MLSLRLMQTITQHFMEAISGPTNPQAYELLVLIKIILVFFPLFPDLSFFERHWLSLKFVCRSTIFFVNLLLSPTLYSEGLLILTFLDGLF